MDLKESVQDEISYSRDDILLLANATHVMAILILLFKLLHTHSCAGVSGRSQILFAIVYLTRYLDLLDSHRYYADFYDFFKVFILASSYGTVFLIYATFGKTYDRKNDTFRIDFPILLAGLLAYFVNDVWQPEAYTMSDIVEILRTFSIYLEAVAILPQLFLVWKTGKIDRMVFYYLLALGSYRVLYVMYHGIIYWLDCKYDPYIVVGGIVQTCLFCCFFFVGKVDDLNETSDDVESSDCPKDGNVFIVSGFLDHVPAEKDGVIKA